LIGLEENDLHGSRLGVVSRVNADRQAALGQRGLKGAGAHQEKRGLRRHAINFFARVRLGQQLHHFNLGSHTLVWRIVRSKRAIGGVGNQVKTRNR